jgi:hypothetical protein
MSTPALDVPPERKATPASVAVGGPLKCETAYSVVRAEEPIQDRKCEPGSYFSNDGKFDSDASESVRLFMGYSSSKLAFALFRVFNQIEADAVRMKEMEQKLARLSDTHEQVCKLSDERRKVMVGLEYQNARFTSRVRAMQILLNKKTDDAQILAQQVETQTKRISKLEELLSGERKRIAKMSDEIAFLQGHLKQ